MAVNKTIELYRLLKKAEPDGDFSAYENRIVDYQISSLDDFLRSLKLSDNEIKHIIFLQTDERNVLSLEKEIDEYKVALTELIDLCREYIKTGADISHLQVAGLYVGNTLNLSSTSSVKNAISALKTAKNGTGGNYLTQNPLEILLNPVTYSNRGKYESSFMSTVGRYVSAESVGYNNVIDHLKDSGCTFVSKSFVETILNKAKTTLVREIQKATKRNTRRLAFSIYFPLFIVLAAFAVPVFSLSALNVQISYISGYRWIIVVAAGLVCGFVPMLLTILLEEKLKAYQQYGGKIIKMFAAPFVVSCLFLIALLSLCNIVLWRASVVAAPAVVAFSTVYFVFYIVAVCVSNKEYINGKNVNNDNTTGLRHMFFCLLKILLPFCISILFADNLGAYILFNLMAIGTCIIYEIAYAANYDTVPSSFLALGLSLCFSLFITSLLALCKVEGLYVYYLVLFNFNSKAMYAVCIIFMLILFAAGISIALYSYYDDSNGWTIAPVIIMLAISLIVYSVGFAKMNKLKKSEKYAVVGNCILMTEGGALKGVYGSTEKLEIPGTVTKISSNIFKNSSSAKEIIVPDSVKAIEKGAFSGCKKLQSVSLPFVGSDSEGTVSQYFGYIFGTESYKGATEIKYNSTSYYFPSNLMLVTIRGGKVGNSAFSDCSFLNEVRLESAVKSLGESIFYGCNNLRSLTLPYVGSNNAESRASKTTLLGNIFSAKPNEGFSAVSQFYNNSSKITFYIPSSLKHLTVLGGKIFYGAFSNCTMLQNVTLEKDVTYIENSAFSGCSGLQNLTVPFVGSGNGNSGYAFFGNIFGSTEYIGGVKTSQKYIYEEGETFSATFYLPPLLKDVTVLNGKISSGAFSNCANLERVTLPPEIKRIGRGAFDGCTKLIKTDGNVQYVDNWAIGYKSGSKSAAVAKNTVGIADGAFDKAITIKSVSLPESISYIGVNAFRDCTEIKDVNYYGTLEKWCQINFANENSSPVKCNFSIKGKLLTSLEVPQSVKVVPGFAFCNIQSIKSLTIHDSVTTMVNSAFRGCTNLTEINYNASDCSGLTEKSEVFAFGGQKASGITVNIGPKVKAIPQYLFYTEDKAVTPNIISLKFNEKTVCTTIESYAFANCESLKEVTLPESVTTVRPYAFAECTTLIECENGIYYAANWVIGYENGIKTATIRPGTIGIADDAFKDCATITQIAVPDTVKKMGKDAFINCSALAEVTIPYKIESFGIDNFKTCPSLKKLVCTSGTFVRFVTLYNYDGSVNSQKLLMSAQTISSSQLSEYPQRAGYLFGGWYTDRSLDMRYIKTEISSSDTGFIDLYPCYIEALVSKTISAENKSWSKTSVSDTYSHQEVSFNVSRMNKLRSYGYFFTFTISYSSQNYSSVSIETSHGHSTDYKASCEPLYTLSYYTYQGKTSNSKWGPSVSAKIISNWWSGGSNTGKASSLVNVSYNSMGIYGDIITLASECCYSASLGNYGTATFSIPAVTVTARFARAN